MASNTILNAGLSVKFRFKDINITDTKRSFIYYGALIAAAVFGAEEFTMSLGLLISAITAHVLLRQKFTYGPLYFQWQFKQFLQMLDKLRWVLLVAFLTTLAMRSDYYVLGKLLSLEDIGFYSFGFMIINSLTIPISAGITQVLLPIFSQLKQEINVLRTEVLRFSSATIF